MNSAKKTGDKGEAFAADYFLNKGFAFRESNYHSRYGEIDIILENSEYIVFVEVKTRKPRAISRGIEAVNKNKRLKIIKTAFVYLLNNPSKKQPRFDVAEVNVDSKGIPENLEHFENAFDLEEYNAIF
jgi:putative endonuclease